MDTGPIDPDTLLETVGAGVLLACTAMIGGLGSISAYILKHGKFPPPATMFATFLGSALLSAIICLGCWRHWEGETTLGCCIAGLAGLGGTQSIYFVLAVFKRFVVTAVKQGEPPEEAK